MNILLVGNPNAGKTTLYNRLTGRRRPVGNRPGVTVETEGSHVLAGHRDLYIRDLPGIYSLKPDSPDEENAVRQFYAECDCIFYVLDMTCLPRGIPLLTEVAAAGRPTVVVLTLADEAEKKRIRVDTAALSALLGLPVYPVSAKSGKGIADLLSFSLPEPAKPILSPPEKIASAVTTWDESKKEPVSDRIDRFLTGPHMGLPLFFVVMALLFFLVFGPLGQGLTDAFRSFLFGPLYGAAEDLLLAFGVSDGLRGFLLSGIFAGVGNVLSFLPQIVLLFFFLTALEDSGYMARVAYLLEPYTRKIGLSGKAAISFLLGFGCTVPAVLSARILEKEEERKRTVLLLPFLTCSARATVYGAFAEALFPEYGFLLLFFLYLLGIFSVLLTGKLLSFRRKGTTDDFCMEFPPYRLPGGRNLFYAIRERIGDFVRKAGSIIFLSSAFLYLLGNFTPAFQPALTYQSSFLYGISSWFAPVFVPLGFGNPEAVAALLSGVSAKEAVLSAFSVLYPGHSIIYALQRTFTQASGVSFLVFLSLYLPCVATVSAVRRETGKWRIVVLFLLYSFALAYLMAFFLYRLLVLFL